jgi:predicted GNAT family acetyltransferase
MKTDIKIINNEQQMRFEVQQNGDVGFLEYRFYKKNIALMHTFVPESMEGKGFASALAAYAFNYAKENKKLVMVYCPFVATYIKRHPEVKEQLDKEYYR